MEEKILPKAIYVRVSTKEQVDKYSLPAQKKMGVNYYKQQNSRIQTIIYEDAGISGETIADRPAMMKILSDAKERKFDEVFVVELERLSRSEDLFDWLKIKKIFRENKIKIATPTQKYDMEDAEDDFVTDLLGILSKREKKKTLQRQKRGKEEMVKQGRFPGGQVPYGYTIEYGSKTGKGELLIDKTESEVVKKIFQLCVYKNYSSRKIAEELTKQGIPTKREIAKKKNAKRNPLIKSWYSGTIYSILTNPVFCGQFAYNKKRGAEQERRAREDWIFGKSPAIISEKMFKIAQERLSRRKIMSRRNKKYNYLLTGLLHCKLCGRRFEGRTFKYRHRWKSKDKFMNEPRYPYYVCYGRSIKESGINCQMPSRKVPLIDNFVWDKISSAIKNPEIIIDAVEMKEKLDNFCPEKELNRINRTLKQKQEEEQRILEAYRKRVISIDQLEQELSKINGERERLHLEKGEIEVKIGKVQSQKNRLALIQNLCYKLGQRLDKVDFETKREIITLIIDKIWIGKNGDIDIECVIPVLEKKEAEERQDSSYRVRLSRSFASAH